MLMKLTSELVGLFEPQTITAPDSGPQHALKEFKTAGKKSPELRSRLSNVGSPSETAPKWPGIFGQHSQTIGFETPRTRPTIVR
jgi:hypothetical protein